MGCFWVQGTFFQEAELLRAPFSDLRHRLGQMQSAMETLGQNVSGRRGDKVPPRIFSLFGWKDFCWGKNVVNSHVFTIVPREGVSKDHEDHR